MSLYFTLLYFRPPFHRLAMSLRSQKWEQHHSTVHKATFFWTTNIGQWTLQLYFGWCSNILFEYRPYTVTRCRKGGRKIMSQNSGILALLGLPETFWWKKLRENTAHKWWETSWEMNTLPGRGKYTERYLQLSQYTERYLQLSQYTERYLLSQYADRHLGAVMNVSQNCVPKSKFKHETTAPRGFAISNNLSNSDFASVPP